MPYSQRSAALRVATIDGQHADGACLTPVDGALVEPVVVFGDYVVTGSNEDDDDFKVHVGPGVDGAVALAWMSGAAYTEMSKSTAATLARALLLAAGVEHSIGPTVSGT
jgi:hypothetical protein